MKRGYLSFDVGIKNLAYCLLDEDRNILLWDVLDISGPTYDKQCEKLIMELEKIKYDSLPEAYNIIVVIEKQMARNPKMRIISGQLQMYFALDKYYSKTDTPEDPKTKIVKVVYYSPKNKLKYYTKEENDRPIVYKTYKNSYDQRKHLAKEHCDIIISRNQPQKFIDFYRSSRKKDDLADSFLQGLAYISSIN